MRGGLVVGVGARRAAGAAEIGALIDAVLRAAALAPAAVRAVATREDRPEIAAAARARGWDVLAYPAGTLASVPVPNPSETVRGHAGTPSVAEAAALHAAGVLGGGGDLVVPKRPGGGVTVAVARLRAPVPPWCPPPRRSAEEAR
ncbi:cobalamin biosynthesis protein [Actinomadura parmotrematis]|uniref:cobalamin biosynthesis protein n=1 Tax=Actinomadura parmotrematis TaxID=2864039 RepID=UPI0027E255E9|nr:cobalamin biosynthesis protein [Actinomadura parmotrematis]